MVTFTLADSSNFDPLDTADPGRADSDRPDSDRPDSDRPDPQALLRRTIALEHKLKYESILHQIIGKLHRAPQEAEILQTVVEELTHALQVTACNVALFHSEPQAAKLQTGSKGESDTAIDRGFPFEIFADAEQIEAVTAYLNLCSHKAEAVQFCLLKPAHSPASHWICSTCVYSICICSIAVEQMVFGHLWLLSPQHRVLDAAELELIQQVAHHSAIALKQVRRYQAAQVQIAALEKLNHLKEDCLSTLSHELRAPVANMRLAVQMLERYLEQPGDIPCGVPTCIEILRNECDRELELLNDLLDLQKLETRHLGFDWRIILLDDWIPQVAFPFTERVASRQQTLQIELTPLLPPLLSDAHSVQRILTELLQNACKYTPPHGTITVNAFPVEDKIVLQVTNTGVEIPSDQTSRIFEKFYRIPDSDRWHQGGTGLGLALVKQLVEHLDGTIAVSSQAGMTCFRVELPQSPVIGGV